MRVFTIDFFFGSVLLVLLQHGRVEALQRRDASIAAWAQHRGHTNSAASAACWCQRLLLVVLGEHFLDK